MVSFDVFYYKSKTKLTSAQHPARVHSCAAPGPPGGEESRVPPPSPLCVLPPRPLRSPPLPAGKPARPGAGGKTPLPGCFWPGKFRSGSWGRCCRQLGCAVPLPGGSLPPGGGTARRAPAAAPGHRRCRRCPAAFVQQWRGGGGTPLLVFTADVFSLTQRLYSSWWPTAESVSRCYLHSLFYGGLKYLYSSNLYRPE